MEDRFIILVWRGDGSRSFHEEFDRDGVTNAVYNIQQDSSVEYIEVISANTNFIWTNPNSNPEDDSF
jgi:hypothetical protein